MTYFIYDLAVIAILVLFFLRGKSKGLILTVCGFLTIFVALIGASVISTALAGPVAGIVRPAVEENIRSVLEEAIRHTQFTAVDGGVAQLPEDLPLSTVIGQLKESQLYQGFTESLQRAADEGLTQTAASAAGAAADFVAVELTKAVLYAVSFVVLLVVWLFVSHALDLAAHLPVLSTLNRWLGGAVGLLEGVVLLFLTARLLLLWGYLPQEAAGETILLRFFCSSNPLSWLGII